MQARTILLIEDEENDVFLFRRALSVLGFEGNVRILRTIKQAREYLAGQNEFSKRDYYAIPDLIVSDMQSMSESAVQLLRWLRKRPELPDLPVVVLSSSMTSAQRDSLVAEGAAAAYQKTGDFTAMKDLVAQILNHLAK
jgi:CheY-like chemotaxis protein